jgi:hypothetical protein
MHQYKSSSAQWNKETIIFPTFSLECLGAEEDGFALEHFDGEK